MKEDMNIIEMARKAGASPDGRLWLMYAEDLERFAALVRAAALEEAKEVLEFHGFDEAVPYIEWAKVNRQLKETK